MFANAKITVTPVSQEADVKAVLTKVSLGEVDAGIVYVTDVKSAGDKVKGIEIPADVNASTTYPIAALTKAANPTAAQAFVDYVLSPEGHGRPRGGRVRQSVSRRPTRPGRAPTVRDRSAVPWPLAVPALVGALFLLVPLAALLIRAPVVRPAGGSSRPATFSTRCGCRSSAPPRRPPSRSSSGYRWPGSWPGPGSVASRCCAPW